MLAVRGLRTNRNEFGDDVGDRLRGIDLVRAGRTQQRFDLREVPEDQVALFGSLPVVVRRPAIDPSEQHVGGCAQKHDRIEVRVEPALIRDGSGHVQGHLAVTGEKLGNGAFAPEVPLRRPTTWSKLVRRYRRPRTRASATPRERSTCRCQTCPSRELCASLQARRLCLGYRLSEVDVGPSRPILIVIRLSEGEGATGVSRLMKTVLAGAAIVLASAGLSVAAAGSSAVARPTTGV